MRTKPWSGPLRRVHSLNGWTYELYPHSLQVTLTYCVISSLGKVTAVRPREPPVSKDNPYHSLSYCKFYASCFFQGKTSIYKLIYNLRENLCYSFYGRLEIDAESEEADIQAITSVQGCLIINGTRIETAALQQITEVTPDQKFCEYTYSLLIYDNPLLTEIKFGKKFRPSSADIFIRNNPKLRSTGIIGAGFKVDIGSGADCLVNEANSNTNCESVVGDVNIADLSSDTWNRIKEVHGTVHVEKTSVSDINHLENLKIVGWKTPALVISKNKNLIDISALLTMSIESKYKPIEIKDNPNICHAIDEEQKLKQWLSGMKSSVKFSRKCLKECAGGQVTNSYLASLDKRCNVIEGTLDISGLKEPPGNFSRLEQVEQIKGRLVVRSSSFIKDLSFLKNLREIKTDGSYKYSYKLLIYGNPQLEKVEFDKKFHLEPNETLIRLNPKLTTAGLKGPKSQVDISEENGTGFS
ncbi:hypothetical protein Y032_0212g2234 [Ancylostoma ceylanicum]|uniref:Receptor L-domain domain-containing protein n=1 Tax=Ancylostoma ceylanicum TaxID=53326 RepID=A0A016SKS7_9BILA|nr:hypothetical protein Y032_0212g2234 [Ancylostoma ceylanicum]